jgi:hypothetical protein
MDSNALLCLDFSCRTIDSIIFLQSVQRSYRSPFVWVRAEVAPNKLVIIECKAFAENIEVDNLHRRGSVKFALNIQK